MPARKKQRTDPKDLKRSRRRKDEDTGSDDGDNFFLEVEDEIAEDKGAESDKEPQETAEEKRLRLAKAYLKHLRATGVGDDEGAGGDLVLGDDDLAEKLREEAQEAGGYLQRRMAERIAIPSSSGHRTEGSKLIRCHNPAVTAVALTNDDATAYSVGKDGCICKLDIASGTRSTISSPGQKRQAAAGQPAPEWIKKGPRQASAQALLAAAVSSDGQLLAVGGGERKVHVWDTRTQNCVQSYPGHKDAITGLAFRQGTHELYSASLDRSVKIWSLDDRAYVDTLFGHQAEALAVDALRQERVVSAGHDRTCRVWKIPEESQLIYRAHGMATDCCRYITGTEWVTGSSDGSLALWSQLKKKPAFIVRNAHMANADAASAQGTAAGWIQSVAVCRGGDLVASGAGDGVIRLWQFSRGSANSRSLQPLGGFAARGFVNALAVASSGKFILAGLGREQRLGRWDSAKGAASGLLLQPLELRDV